MAKPGVERNRDVKPISHRHAGPEIRAEKVHEERFQQARREDRVIAGVRSKIDKGK
ncbi:MAG: hypothetical protein A4E28_02929 [Methanocella sp. PtaU1.Bin125]|nr:MAG: hypothetical protein A4E28_02929 [Methanocella sp. PtaU1.Bin125]